MIVKPTVFSAMVGGGSLPSSFDFNDAANDLNSQHSINKIEFSTGWVVDGMRVTYGTEQGLERQIVHGTFRSSGNKLVTIGADEFISKAEGQHGRPNGQYDYGDCIQKIRFRITNSKTKEERYTEYFGAAEQGQNLQSFSWEGHMFAFAGRADNSLSQVGLKGLRFGALSGDKVTLALSVPHGGDRSPQIAAKPYNDIVQFGAALDFKKPIKSIAVWSGQVVDGLEITYNLSDGTTLTVMHGAQGGGKTVVDIAPTERIVEINGIWGLSSPSTNWGVQMQLLRFTIFDSVTQFYRTTNAFGMPSAKDFVQETRKDICVRGPFVGVSGTADNNLKQVGLDTTVFYTQCPAI